eukprot:5704614-Ditylum_brightwellii.AAC.1
MGLSVKLVWQLPQTVCGRLVVLDWVCQHVALQSGEHVTSAVVWARVRSGPDHWQPSHCWNHCGG